MSPQSPSFTATLRMGTLTLLVRDLSQQVAFYRDLVGLEVVANEPGRVTLGYEQHPVLHLIESATLPFAGQNSAGLYHTAILFKSRQALAHALRRILSARPELYGGSADHLVSEAFYFSDPEGNGVELYFDKDPATWQWQDGTVIMASLPLSIQRYCERFGDTPESTATTLGHVHLKVGNIAEAKLFYVDVLGLHITSEMPTALFLSDGTYHHHLGMNVWESLGAGVREAAVGLESFEMYVANRAELTALAERLTTATVLFTSGTDILTVRDPWGSLLHFRVG